MGLILPLALTHQNIRCAQSGLGCVAYRTFNFRATWVDKQHSDFRHAVRSEAFGRTGKWFQHLSIWESAGPILRRSWTKAIDIPHENAAFATYRFVVKPRVGGYADIAKHVDRRFGVSTNAARCEHAAPDDLQRLVDM